MSTLSRRDLLTLFLGAPLALQACRQGEPRRSPDGEIVGQSADLGHILRTPSKYEVPSQHWETKKIVIVGGGIAGLTAAWKLKRDGVEDFVLVELEKELGGTSRSGTGEPVGYPWAAHYLPVPFADNTELIELLDEMSLTEGRAADGGVVVKEQYLCRDPEERVFYKGRWYDGLYLHVGESEDDKRQFAEFQRHIDYWVNWRDAAGRRAFVVPSAKCSDDAEVTALDKISFGDWLRQKGLTSGRLVWYCDYACRDDYGLKLEQTSAWAGLFYFCSRVRKSGDESQPFITFPEGNGRFVSHFVGKTAEQLRRSMMAVEIVPTDEGVDVILFATRLVPRYPCRKSDLRRTGIYCTVPDPRFSRRCTIRRRRVSTQRMVCRKSFSEGPAKAAVCKRFSARLGQRYLRKPIARLRHRNPSKRHRLRPDRAHLLLSDVPRAERSHGAL
jgi:hypothetical protein